MMIAVALHPALRCTAAGITMIAAGCGAIAEDTCHDGGGVWDAELSQCYCSQRQIRSDNEWREWCADLSNLDSIKRKAAEVPAPTGD